MKAMKEFPIYTPNVPKLAYMEDSRFVPIPPHERMLQSVTAIPYLKVSDEFEQLEGLCFDRKGDMYFVGIYSNKIFKVEMESKKLSVVYTAPEGYGCAALKIHKNGRLFICCLGDFSEKGCIFSINPDGSDFQMVIPFEAGYVVDDMVFDSDGSFYFTDYKGAAGNPNGGIYHVSADFQTITPVVQNMYAPNGITLTSDRSALWVTESCANRLHYIALGTDRKSTMSICDSVPYTFTGYFGPDSCCIDCEDNLYVAMYEQGRVMVFNKFGYPIGQVLMPGRDEGHMLRTEHPMLRPGTDELYITTNDYTRGGGAWIMLARGFADAYMGGYQFQEDRNTSVKNPSQGSV